MPRSKSSKPSNGIKRKLDDETILPATEKVAIAKKAKLLDDSDDEVDEEAGGISLKVNEEYARRFEHNKKREEKHKCTLPCHSLTYAPR